MDQNDVLVAIVDDDESIRKALSRLFRLNGFGAEAFSSATDFLDSLSERMPECVVLDLYMPGMTGIELLQRLRKLEKPPPVVVITAHNDAHVRKKCERLGSSSFLLKPIDSAKLLDAVRAAVGRA